MVDAIRNLLEMPVKDVTQRSITVSPETHAMIGRIAKETGKSMKKVVEAFLTQGLEEFERLQSDPVIEKVANL